MTRPSEKEIIAIQSSNLFILEKMIARGAATMEEIGEQLPTYFHLNKPTGEIKYINPGGRQWMNLSLEEILGLGYDFILNYVHQETINHVRPRFMEFYLKNDSSALFTYLQKIKPNGHEDFSQYLTISKVYRKAEGILSITHHSSGLESIANKLARIMDEEVFIRKNHVKFSTLTKREKEIMTLLVKGYNNPDIAEILFISRSTVEQHRKNINRKLEVSSFAQLLRYAYAFDLLRF